MEQGSDTKPRFISISPVNNSVDSDGYIFFNCSVTDDYALANISLYSDITGTWALEDRRALTGLSNSTVFNLTNLSNGQYEWACVAYDNASQEKWSDTYVVNVSVGVNLYHHVPKWMVNDVNTSRYVIITYSEYLNNSLTLGNLTIREADGEFYAEKNLSENSFSGNSLMIHPELVEIIPYEIFDGDFGVGNVAGLNFSFNYTYHGVTYEVKDNVTIEIVNETRW